MNNASDHGYDTSGQLPSTDVNTFSDYEREIARAGFCYLRDPMQVRNGKRAVVRSLTHHDRTDVTFDVPAYETHKKGKTQ